MSTRRGSCHGLLAGWLACGVMLGCAEAGADSAEVEETRARIEAEFGPRDSGPLDSELREFEPGDPGLRDEGDPPAADPTAENPPDARGDTRGDSRVDEGSEPADGRISEESSAAATPVEDAPTPVRNAPGPGEAGAVSVDSLLALADAAYVSLERLRAAFTQRIENPLLGRTREGRGNWYQAGRNRFRMDFDEPADDIYVADGSCLWLYEPSLHDQVIVSSLEEGVEIGTIDILGRLLSEARTRYDGVDGGIEVIDATETRVVSLTPRQRPARYVEVGLWIGVSDYYVRRFRIREENATLRTVTLTRLEPQARIDDAVFDFAPPVGVPIFPDDVRCD